MITRATLSTIEQGLPKYRSMLAGNAAYQPTAYESIASASPSNSTVTFSSIPATYKHLQLRALFTSGGNSIQLRLNGDSATNYSNHNLYATASAAAVDAFTNQTSALLGNWYGGFPNNNFPGVMIVDILDYASTDKFKTVKAVGGMDNNNDIAPWVGYGSGLWRDTSAVTSLSIPINVTGTFALYGIKG